MLAAYSGKIIITGDGTLAVADTCQGEALFNYTNNLYIENGTFNGEVGSNWSHTININGGVFNDIVKFDGDAVISGGNFQRLECETRWDATQLAMLDAERENDSVKTFSDRYSTYAIVYEDARNVTPQTADNATLVVYITVFALELVGAAIVIYSKKYKEE